MSTFVDPRTAAYFWARLSPTQQHVLRGAADNDGAVPFAGTIATMRVLRRQGYIDNGQLTEDGKALVLYARAAVVKA